MSDCELLRQMCAGDPQAFSLLFRRYWPRVFRMARAMLKSEYLAEETVQEVFLRIWRNRSSLIDVESLEAYLFVSTRNHILNTLRRDGLRAELMRQIPHSEIGDGNRVEAEVQLRDHLGLLEKAVNGLPPQQQVAFRLAHHSGLAISEIGLAMGLSLNTVRNHLARARQTLRSQLRRLQES